MRTIVRPDSTGSFAAPSLPDGRSERPADGTRARHPDRTGVVTRDGIRVAYEVYGHGDPGVVFVPPWSIVHSRIWKAQIADTARRHLVVAFDPRGNGRSDRPTTAAAYGEEELGRDLLAVMDAVGMERAVLVSLSSGAERALVATREAPERVAGHVFICPAVAIGRPPADQRGVPFDDPDGPDDGWSRYNAHSWRRDFDGFLSFFFGRCFTEPHSTKQIEDAVGWGREIGPEALILSEIAPGLDRTETLAIASTIRCPVLVIQGTEDAVTGPDRGRALAAAIPGARLVRLVGAGHIPNARDPVAVNLLLRDFLGRIVAGRGAGGSG